MHKRDSHGTPKRHTPRHSGPQARQESQDRTPLAKDCGTNPLFDDLANRRALQSSSVRKYANRKPPIPQTADLRLRSRLFVRGQFNPLERHIAALEKVANRIGRRGTPRTHQMCRTFCSLCINLSHHVTLLTSLGNQSSANSGTNATCPHANRNKVSGPPSKSSTESGVHISILRCGHSRVA
jgi:hypothetical protein